MWPAKLAHPFTMLPRECETPPPPPKNYEGTKEPAALAPAGAEVARCIAPSASSSSATAREKPMSSECSTRTRTSGVGGSAWDCVRVAGCQVNLQSDICH